MIEEGKGSPKGSSCLGTGRAGGLRGLFARSCPLDVPTAARITPASARPWMFLPGSTAIGLGMLQKRRKA